MQFEFSTNMVHIMYIAESYIGIYRYQTTQPRNYRGCEFFLWTQLLGIKIGRCDLFAQKTQNLNHLNRVLFFCQIWYRITKSHLGLFGLKGETHDEFGPGGHCYGAFRLTTPLSELPKKKPKLSNHAPWIHCSSSMATSRHSRHYKVPSLSAPQLSCVLVNLGEFSLAEFLESIFRGSVYHSLYFLVFWHFMNTFSHFTLVFSSSLLKVAGRLVIRFMG